MSVHAPAPPQWDWELSHQKVNFKSAQRAAGQGRGVTFGAWKVAPETRALGFGMQMKMHTFLLTH